MCQLHISGSGEPVEAERVGIHGVGYRTARPHLPRASHSLSLSLFVRVLQTGRRVLTAIFHLAAHNASLVLRHCTVCSSKQVLLTLDACQELIT